MLIKSLGQYQAWVMAGKTKADREARYLASPDEMKPQIASHIRTVRGLKEVAELKRRRKKDERKK